MQAFVDAGSGCEDNEWADYYERAYEPVRERTGVGHFRHVAELDGVAVVGRDANIYEKGDASFNTPKVVYRTGL